MNECLYVEEGTGLVRKVKLLAPGIALSDEPYKPNGKCVFVNPKTNFLEEGDLIHDPCERVVRQSWYRKTSNFTSNRNPVLFHPKRKEFAEVTERYEPGAFEKVRNLQIIGTLI